ncbi:MAG: hypothetical protein ACQERB_01090 [Promethearchaeati archaeon]
MTAQDIQIQDNDICEKCGSKMIIRKLSIKNNGAVKWKYIKQCKVCRHWINIQ